MGIKVKKFEAPTVLRIFVLAALILIGGFGVSQQVQAAQTPTAYCSKYPDNTPQGSMLRSACRDGLKIADGKSDGAKCEDYALIADQATVDICTTSQKERAETISGKADIVSGEETETEETTTPTPSATPTNSPPANNGGSILDILDETKNLSDYIDILHQAGPNAKVDTKNTPDNEYGKYINGAGQKQRITPDLSGKENSPAIIIINGGGWHANDQNDDFIRENKPDVIHGRTQTGPTAKQRGYTVFELTYRLGSSGVYYMYEDVMRGIEHVRNNAGMYGIDPNKIAIWGDSAGGSLSVRAGASGKSGAKVAVGWSPPTNAYTAIFRSYKSLMIGMDHSTCIPTDLAGLTNITDLFNGGNGDIAEYGKGLSSNDFSIIGMNGGDTETDPMSMLFQVLTAGQYALKTGQNIESISQQLEAASNGGNPTLGSITSSGLAGGFINMSSKKLIECMDNMEALSPALYASPDSTPMFLAGFTTDDVVGPDQVYGMHDKLQSLGIRSETKVIPGTDVGSQPLGPNPGNHLDYDARFVCPTLNFIDSVIQPGNGTTNCETGQSENLGSAGSTAGGNVCTSRVDSRIRIKNVQEVDLSAVVMPDPRVSNGGVGSKVGDGGVGKDAKSGQNKNIDGKTKNKPKVGNTNKSKDPSVGGNKTEDTKQQNQSGNAGGGGTSGGGSSGSGSGGCGGGGGASTPSTAGGSGAGGIVDQLGQLTGALGQLGGLAGAAGNLGGIGGFGGSKNNETAGTGSSSNDPNNIDGGGKAEDANGARGGAKFTASKTSGDCQIDYTRAPNAATGGNNLVATCGEKLAFINSLTSDVIHVKPIQMLVVPAGFSDNYLKSDACKAGVAFAFHRIGRIYYCAGHLQNNPNDRGMAIHEVTHLTQGYKDAPGWVTEGIADFVRYKYEPKAAERIGCSAGDTYTSGYSCSASLFAFVERQYKKNGLVKNIHTQAKAGNFTLSLITSGTGKNIDQLYSECLKPGAECNVANRTGRP